MDASDINHGGAFVPDEDVYQAPAHTLQRSTSRRIARQQTATHRWHAWLWQAKARGMVFARAPRAPRYR